MKTIEDYISVFMYPNKVKKTTKGTRYSFVSWAF